MATNATSYARPSNPNMLLDPLVYWRVSAFALTAVALLGILMAALFGGGHNSAHDQPLAFDGNQVLGLTWTHNIVHVVLAAAAFVFGFANLPGKAVKTFAILFGFVYLGLGILGFIVANPLGTGLALNLGAALNVTHILLGGWALTAGFAARY